MASERKPVSVSLPEGLVEKLDRLVEDGEFGSRSDALRYGARLVVREHEHPSIHDQAGEKAKKAAVDRLERKRVSRHRHHSGKIEGR